LFIDVNTPHAVHAFGESGRGGKPFGDALPAPVEELFPPRLMVCEFSRGQVSWGGDDWAFGHLSSFSSSKRYQTAIG
jgi:hypothetical protein